MRNADDGGYLSYILLDSANIIRDGDFTLEGRRAVNLIAESLEIPFLEVFEGQIGNRDITIYRGWDSDDLTRLQMPTSDRSYMRMGRMEKGMYGSRIPQSQHSHPERPMTFLLEEVAMTF